MELNTYLLGICAVVYCTLSVLIAIQARQKANMTLAVCCGLTALFMGLRIAFTEPDLYPFVDFLDLLRVLCWYCYLLNLYRLSGAASLWQLRCFGCVPVLALVAGMVAVLTCGDPRSTILDSWPLSIRLVTCISELLLIENLYFNLPERSRWHIAIPCILLGGLVCFDILVIADAIIFHRVSTSLVSGRTVAMIIVAPLLVLAASRGQRWKNSIRLSRAAVFHSATLILSGSVLLALAVVGEILRQLDASLGWAAELTLVFLGVIGSALCLTSRSARSILDRVVVHHFFADRYDYRAQWLSCIETLSGRTRIEESDLETRAIQAVADVVNSPSGSLFIRDNMAQALVWTRSWNMSAAQHLSLSHRLLQKIFHEQNVIDLRSEEYIADEYGVLGELGSVWLAVPLLHSSGVIGVVVLGPPRTAFQVDQEVFDLLTILGQEVGTYIAEQRSTEAVLQTRSLHEYGKRFAFVAHDVKNVSSQLALLLRNAETHLENPEFQVDMLETVRSSVIKIDRLLKRLDDPCRVSVGEAISVVANLESLVSEYRRTRDAAVSLVHDDKEGRIFVNSELFETAVLHLLNNAVEASSPVPVVVRVKHGDDDVVIDITDEGAGMSPEFVRDELFRPFRTKKGTGSGIGAFQARELISEAGGQLLVTSETAVGTTMRLVFKCVHDTNARMSLTTLPKVSGGQCG